VKRRRRGWSPDNHAYQHRSPDPTKIERATATSTAALFILFVYRSDITIQIQTNIKSREPDRFSVQKARMNNQLREFITANQMLQGRKTMFGTQVIQGVPVGGVGGFCANNQGGRGLK
jgi:hypothetical protein